MKPQFKTELKDVYQMVTDKIIARLEQGFIPWRKPWNHVGAACNYITKKPYMGINSLLLNSMNLEHPYFITFKQASELGGRIRKGAKAEIVTFWNWLYTDKESGRKLEPGQVQGMPAGRIKKMAFLRYYNVFNIADVEGVDFDIPEVRERALPERIEHCESIIAGIPNPPTIQYGGDRAYYSPLRDYVNMPQIKHFESSEFYYAVFFHELTHATGNPKRLGRKEEGQTNKFGSEEYSKEELIAELGSSFLCGVTGIQQQTIENSAAYIQNWLQVLRNDKRFVVEAAGKAQQAVNYMLNIISLSEETHQDGAAEAA